MNGTIATRWKHFQLTADDCIHDCDQIHGFEGEHFCASDTCPAIILVYSCIIFNLIPPNLALEESKSQGVGGGGRRKLFEIYSKHAPILIHQS